MRRQHVQGLTQDVDVLLVIGDQDGVEMLGNLGLDVSEVAGVAILGVARGGRGARRREGLGGRERVGRELALRTQAAPLPGRCDLFEAPRDVPDSPACAEGEDGDDEVDDQRVVGKEDGQEAAARPSRAWRGLQHLVLTDNDYGAEEEQSDEGEAADAPGAPGEKCHDGGEEERRRKGGEERSKRGEEAKEGAMEKKKKLQCP